MKNWRQIGKGKFQNQRGLAQRKTSVCVCLCGPEGGTDGRMDRQTDGEDDGDYGDDDGGDNGDKN